MYKKFYSCHWFLKNHIFFTFSHSENAEICRVGILEPDFQQVPLVQFL